MNSRPNATSAVGTKPYQAPELFDSTLAKPQRYSKAIDVYAFGILANELYVGEIYIVNINSDDDNDDCKIMNLS